MPGYLYIIVRSSLVSRLHAVLLELEAWRERVYLDTPRLSLRRCEAFRFVARPTHPEFDDGTYVGVNVEVFVETFEPVVETHAPYLAALSELTDVAVVCTYTPRELPAPPPSYLLTKRDYRHPGQVLSSPSHSDRLRLYRNRVVRPRSPNW